MKTLTIKEEPGTMLVLTHRVGEWTRLTVCTRNGPELIHLKVTRISGNQVKIAFDAAQCVRIHRLDALRPSPLASQQVH